MNRLKQALVILVGLALAGGMAVLGIWQLDVYRSQGYQSSQARASAPPVGLLQVAAAGAPISDGFGRAVSFSGEYDPSLQLLVPLAAQPGSFRVLTGMRLAGGEIVPVVRGVVPAPSAPPPPRGPLAQSGVLLPSEDNEAPAQVPESTQLSSVRLPALAQRWPGELVGGYVTLPPAAATAQGLQPALLALPPGHGRLRNGAYALQWWVFGGFAVAMSIRVARDLALRDEVIESEPSPVDDPISTEPPTGVTNEASRETGSHRFPA